VSDRTDSFEGQWALVTGAGGGIGSAIAEALAARGARVGLVGRRRGPLTAVARRIGSGFAEVVQVDVTDDAAAKTALTAFLRRAGRLDVLVHSAGIHAAAPLDRARVSDFDRIWATNVRAPFLVTQRLVPALRSSRGQIVFVSSSAALSASPGTGQYSAAQHALHGLADAFRSELNPDGIRVLTVYPGRTATAMQARIHRDEGRRYLPERLLQPSDIARTVLEALALPRSAEVTDVRIRSMLKP
jgi:NADP-dependent 3-hydroxy acid dehydrogenase YdfG